MSDQLTRLYGVQGGEKRAVLIRANCLQKENGRNNHVHA